MRTKNPPSIVQRAIALLARREHSRAELARKLQRCLPPDSDAAEIESVLEQLQTKGMLSDARFAATLVRTRAERFGVARIRQELKRHDLAADLVLTSLGPLQASEFERARQIWYRKFGAPATTDKERARQMRFLSSRGFAADVVVRVVRGEPTDR